jgi:hypothetical protein
LALVPHTVPPPLGLCFRCLDFVTKFSRRCRNLVVDSWLGGGWGRIPTPLQPPCLVCPPEDPELVWSGGRYRTGNLLWIFLAYPETAAAAVRNPRASY